MGRFDQLSGLTESHSKADLKPLEVAVRKAYATLDPIKGAPGSKEAKALGKAKGLLLVAKKELFKLQKTAESDSRFDELAGLTEADELSEAYGEKTFKFGQFQFTVISGQGDGFAHLTFTDAKGKHHGLIAHERPDVARTMIDSLISLLKHAKKRIP